MYKDTTCTIRGLAENIDNSAPWTIWTRVPARRSEYELLGIDAWRVR